MSVFSRALPGKIPTYGGGSGNDLFDPAVTRSKFQSMLEDGGLGQQFPFSDKAQVVKVKVEIFDLSDESQREAYEKLWIELFDMSSRGEALIVDSRKDLVHRPDGTSYWMKYVEYAVFGKKDGKDGGENNKSTEGNK